MGQRFRVWGFLQVGRPIAFSSLEDVGVLTHHYFYLLHKVIVGTMMCYEQSWILLRGCSCVPSCFGQCRVGIGSGSA